MSQKFRSLQTWVLLLAITIPASRWCIPCHAQNPSAQTNVVWMGPNHIALFKDDKASIQVELAQPGAPASLSETPLPEAEEAFIVAEDFFEGAFWATASRKNQDREGKVTAYSTELFCRKEERGAWESIGTLQQPYFRSAEIRPLGNGHFLAFFHGLRPIPGTPPPGGGFRPLAILKAVHSKNSLVIDEWLDLGLEQPYFKPTKQWTSPDAAKQLNGTTNYPGLGLEFLTSRIARVDEKTLVLPATRGGYFFVFDGNTGRLTRTVKLYSSVTEQLLKDANLGWVAVGYQPTPDGRLLVAARQEAGVVQFKPVPLSTDLSQEEFEKVIPLVRKKLEENISTYPLVMWFTLDLTKGEVHDEAPPQNFPSFIRNSQELSSYKFRFKADGNLIQEKGDTSPNRLPKRPK